MTFPAIPDQASAMALAMQFQFDQTQWLSEEDIQKKQLLQLRPLLEHAKNTTPYYRDCLPQNLINKELSWNDFLSLPILSREIVRDKNEMLISSNIPKAHSNIRSTQTSGSTGTPVTIYLSDINHFLWRAFALRDHHWHNRDLTGVLCSIRWLDKSTASYPHGLESPSWGAITDISFNTGKSYLLNVSSSIEEQVEWLTRKQPDYILSFPSNLMALAEHCLKNSIQFNNLKQVRTVGETLRPDMRALIEKAWGVPITDMYTCEETGYLALQCPEHNHYHIQSENVILEVLNDNNEPCEIGEEGRVVFTSLHNYCSPLIRYELGDRAILGEPCSCGRGLPVLQSIFGRQRNRILMPDGTRQFPYLGDHGETEEITGITPKQTQFIQKTIEHIEVTFAIERSFNITHEKKLDTLYKTIFGEHFNFTYRYVESIPKGPRGKFEDFICQC